MVIDLRAAGYYVVSISEQMSCADDQTVIDFARSEKIRGPLVDRSLELHDMIRGAV
jgi:hypothetical protein